MHGIGNFLIFIVVYKIIKYMISSLSKDHAETTVTGSAKEKFHYLFNDRKINKSSFIHAYEVLDLNIQTPMTPEKINHAYFKQLEFAEEDIILGFKVKHVSADLEAARDFLLDYYDYAHCRN